MPRKPLKPSRPLDVEVEVAQIMKLSDERRAMGVSPGGPISDAVWEMTANTRREKIRADVLRDREAQKKRRKK